MSATPSLGRVVLLVFLAFFPTVFRGCSHNEEISAQGRVGKLLPMHVDVSKERAVLKAWKSLKYVQDHLRNLVRPVRSPMSYTEWVSSFPPAKRAMFLKLRDENAVLPETKIASAFIKRELALRNQDSYMMEPIKDPRWIQGCPPELTMHTGVWVRKLAKNLKTGIRPKQTVDAYEPACINEGRQIIYTSGMSAEAVGDAFARCIATITATLQAGDKVVFLEDDQSRFDLHMTKGPFMHLNHFYRDKLGRKRAGMLKRNDKSQGKSKLRTRYSVPYTMQSGWPDTSCGDSYVNAMMKYHIHGIGRNWISIICGDDSVTITTSNEIARIGGLEQMVRAYGELGMEVEMKLTPDPLVVEFCSSVFLKTRSSYVLFPKIGKILARLGWDMVDRNLNGEQRWLLAISDTLMTYGHYDPLCRAFANNIRNRLAGLRRLKIALNPYAHHYDLEQTTSNYNIQMHYHIHYGLSVSDVGELTRYLLDVDIGLMTHPLLVEMARRDV